MPAVKSAASPPQPELIRTLGKWDLTALGVNQLIGSGIFVLPATVALLVGAAASPLAWITAAAANALIVLCFAEAATRFNQAGGPYLYARQAFGSFVGFETAWMIWLTRVASQAALANAFASYLAYPSFLPGADTGNGRVLVVSAVILILTAINVRGVRQGSWLVNFFTVTKLAALLGFVALGLLFVDPANFRGLTEPRWEGFGRSVLLLMFAFGGFEVATLPAGEARSPRRDVPAALLLTITIGAAFYLSVQIVAVGTLPSLGATDTPLADAARGFLGPAGGLLIALGGLISIAGTNAGTMLAGPRVTYALGEREELPRIFRHVHRRFRTPDFSIGFYSLVALGLALSGTFEEMAAVSAVARLVFYAVTCAAVPVLRRQGGAQEGFRLPLGPVIPVLACLVSRTIIAGAGPNELLAGAGALVVGALLFAAGKTRPAKPLGGP